MNFSIKSRLLGLLSALGLILLATSGLNLVVQTDAQTSLTTIHADRVVPLRDLKDISDQYAVFIVDATHKVRSGAFSWQEGEAAIRSAAFRIAELWRAYVATYLVEEEKALVAQAEPLMTQADSAITEVLAIIAANDGAALDAFVNETLYPKIDPITEVIGKLIAVQVRVAEAEFAGADAAFEVSMALSLVLLAIAVAGIGFGFVLVTRGIIKPINGMTSAMAAMAQGKWNTEVPGIDRKDEIGLMAKSVAIFRSNGIENERLTAEQKSGEQVERQRRAELLSSIVFEFDDTMSETVRTITSAATELQVTAQSMAQNASRTLEKANSAKSTSGEASANVQAVASAAEEMSASISEIGVQVSGSSDAAKRAVAAAESANTQVSGLVNAAQKIGDVVRLISDIAGQTNLLALNATIEAARAGEAGRGFAVVATEVKALAGQTAKATEEISGSISQIQSVIARSADAISNIGNIIGEISAKTGAMATAIDEQNAATAEIARNVQGAAKGTQDAARDAASVGESVGETGAAASQVLSASGGLLRQAEAMRCQMGTFVTRVKAL